MKKFTLFSLIMILALSVIGCVKQPSADIPVKEITLTADDTLPPYEYDESSPQEAAIFAYFTEKEDYNKPYGTVTIPAYCIFRSEALEDNRIKVYGNFWTFTYSKKDNILFCESGGECPGVIYLKETNDSYVVEKMERVGDGADYAKDIERICGKDNALKEQYFSATDARKEPLKSKRLWYIYQYVKDHELDITAYQDYGWEPVPLSQVEEWRILEGNR